MARKKPTKKRMRTRLDIACRDYIKARDQYICQTCGIHRDATPLRQIDWAHKVSRKNLLLRWNQTNSISQCRKCHNDWGDGITQPTNDAIDRLWGEGTARKLELIAKQYSHSRGTYLDSIDFRISLETYFKKLTIALEGGCTPSECMETTWTDWGTPGILSIYEEENEEC